MQDPTGSERAAGSLMRGGGQGTESRKGNTWAKWFRLLVFLGVIAIWLAPTVAVNLAYRRQAGPAWRNYSTDNAKLPDDTIYALQTDAKGNVFIGTRNGFSVVRPDGTWEAYAPMPSGLSGEDVYAFAVDRSDRLYVGTDAGLNVLHPSGSWSFYDFPHVLFRPDVLALAVDARDRVWIGSGTGLYVLDGNGEPRLVDHGLEIPSQDGVTALFIDGSDRLWIGADRGIGYLDPAGGGRAFGELDSGSPNRDVRSIQSDSHGRIWVRWGGDGRSVSVYGLDGEWKGSFLGEPTFGVGLDIPVNLAIDVEDRVWAGFAGALRYSEGDGEWRGYSPTNSGMGHWDPSIVLVDAAGRLWVGSQDAHAVIVGDDLRQLKGRYGVSVWDLSQGLPTRAPRDLARLRGSLISPITTIQRWVNGAREMIELSPGLFVPLTAFSALNVLLLLADALWLILSPNRKATVVLAVLLTLIAAQIYGYSIVPVLFGIGAS